MKVRDLMRGDKVYETLLEDTPQVVTVEEVGQNHIYIGIEDDDMALLRYEPEHLGWDIKNIEPIPLTEEILKKNADGGSCSFDEFRSLYHLKNNGYHREISISFNKTWNVPFVEITGMGRTTIKVNMQYVHELQHALRLCGLNDLADNFKV